MTASISGALHRYCIGKPCRIIQSGGEDYMARELYAEVCSYESVGYLLGVPARTVADWIRRDTRWGRGE